MNTDQTNNAHATILRIGQVARAGGITVQTVRYYEREGLLETPSRSDSGYRLYQPSSIERLHFIARARRLGFSLAETRELLALEMNPSATCGEVEARAKLKLADLDERIEQLQSMRGALGQLLAQCRGEQPASHCPILRSLEERQS